MGTFSAQYPPTEWFNPRVVHLHSVATQTRAASPSVSFNLDAAESKKQNKYLRIFAPSRRKLNGFAEIESRDPGQFDNEVTLSDDGGSRSIAGQFPSMG